MRSLLLSKSALSRHAGTCVVATPTARPNVPGYLRALKHFFVGTTALCAAMIVTRPALAQSPTGGNVVAGSAGISQLGNITNINQSSQRAIINWQGFSVGAQNTVNFYQPGVSSVTLNRVIGNETSVINGAINANGQVFIVNSAGVLFGKGSQINVGGLVASTLDIANNDFMAGNYKFSGNSAASIVNQGRITAHGVGQGGGYVALLGRTVSNEGVIAAKLGTVAMASGDKMTLNFGGDSLVDVTIDKGTLNALVQNKRAIIANGGTVIMTAKAADQVLSAQVNNSGIIQARSMAALKGGSTRGSSSRGTVKLGKIQLVADGGNVTNTGKLNASAKGNSDAGSIKILASGGTASIAGTLEATAVNGNGGFIETSGDHVHVADSALITTKSAYGKTGTWLIDPDGFTIAASGGDITGTALSNQLASNNVTIASTDGSGTDGMINVNDAVSWSSGSSLTLNADNSININAAITAPNGKLALNAYTNPDATNDLNINAVDALNVASISGIIYGSLNINQSQTWTTPPDISKLNVLGVVSGVIGVSGMNINAPVTWSSGTLVLNGRGVFTINPGGSLNGPTIDLNATNFNLNAENAFNVTTVIGTQTYKGLRGDFTINAPQTWTIAPDLSGWGIAGNLNVNAALSWSSGTLTLASGNNTSANVAAFTTHDVNVNAVLTGPSLVFKALDAVNVSVIDTLNVGTISGTVGGTVGSTVGAGDFDITAAQTWTTPPDMSALSVAGNTNVNAPLAWTTGVLTLKGGNINIDASLSGNALVFDSPGAVNVSAVNALNVGSINGTAGGGFNIDAAQTWVAAPPVIVSGDINVNAPLTWSTGELKLAATDNIGINTALGWSSGTLTLNAGKNIYVNATMTASGTANLAVSYGRGLDASGNPTGTATAGTNADGTPFGLYLSTDSHSDDSGAIVYSSIIDFSSTGTISFNGQAYTVITSLAGFDAINLSGNYVLGKDIAGLSLADLSAFGFSSGAQFTGNFNGLGHTLTTVSLPSFTLPSSIAALNGTSLVLNSTGTVSINGNVTSGAGILTLNAATLMIAPPVTVSGLNLVVNAPISWSSNAGVTFTAYDNLNINSSITATGDSASLTLKANAGDISINNAITFTGANATLTMNYGGDYFIRTPASYAGAVLDANGNLVAQVDPHDPANGGDGVYGSVTLSGANAGLTINNQTYILIHSMSGFPSVMGSSSARGYYALAQNLYATSDGTSNGTPTPYTATVVSSLDGTFAGLGNTISDLTINSPGTYNNTNTGLFGIVGNYQASIIRDVGLVNVNISGPGYTGGLAAQLGNNSSINDVYVTGSVASSITGNFNGGQVGGVVGNVSNDTTISNAFFSGSMGGTVTQLGGLVGNASGNGIVIRNSHANVDINANIGDDIDGSSLGGLIGTYRSDTNGEISGTYSTGSITLTISDYYAAGVGGLIGNMSQWQFATDGSHLTNSFSTVKLAITLGDSLETAFGGLVGNLSSSHIDNVYASGEITIDALDSTKVYDYTPGPVGGLVGQASGTDTYLSTITNAAAYGNVSILHQNGGGDLGGFIGWTSHSVISNSQAWGDVTTPAFGLGVSVGGFAGGNAGTILNSVAHGKVTVTPGPLGQVTNGWIGGFVGQNTAGEITNSYYNVDANPAPVGSASSPGVGFDYTGNANPTGLTRAQLNDAQYYMNGTINQVLAARATAAQAAAERQATIQQATNTANATSNDAQTSSTTSPDTAASKGGASAAKTAKSEAVEDELNAVDDNVKTDDERKKHERERTAQTNRRNSGGEGGLGATIRSIDVDGQRFNLQDNDKSKSDDKSNSGAPEERPH